MAGPQVMLADDVVQGQQHVDGMAFVGVSPPLNDGAIVRRWRPSTPDDRVAPLVIAAAARGHPLG